MSQTDRVLQEFDDTADRYELLTGLDLLDSPPLAEFDRLLKLATRLLDASLAQITFVTSDEEWIIHSDGTGFENLDNVRSVCARTVSEVDSPIIISDLASENSIDESETVIDAESYRSYAGFPINLEETAIGAFCVWDDQPRNWTEQDRENLDLIAGQLQDLLDRHRQHKLRTRKRETLNRYRNIIENLPVGVFRTTPAGEIVSANPEVLSMMRAESEEELVRHNLSEIYVDNTRREEILEELQETGSVREEEVLSTRLDGEEFWALLSLQLIEEDGQQYIDGTVRDITERREAQEELEATARRLELTTQAGGIGLWEWDVGTDDVFWDDRLKEILGQESESFEDFINQIHVEDQPRVQKAINRAIENQATYHEVFRIHHPASGDQRWVEAQGEVRLESDSGKMMYGTARDVTDREEAYRSLEQSEEQLRTIVNNTQDIFTVVSEEGEILYESPSIEMVLGYDEEELVGYPAFKLIHPEDRELVYRTFDELLESDSGLFHRVECRVRNAEGDWVWLEITGSSKYQPVWDGYLLSSRDITERKEAEKALRKRDRQFRQMADNVDEVFWIHDTETNRVVYVSPAAEEIWGEPPEEFLGSSSRWLNSIIDEDRDQVAKHFREHFDDQFDIEYRIKRPDGETRWIHDHGYPVTNDEGNVIRLVGTARDITERKQAEQELEATINELQETTVSRNYLENIITTMPSTLMVVAGDGTIDRVNSALCELTGYSREELTGEPLEKVLEDNPPAEINNLLRDTGSNSIQSIELQYQTKQGNAVPVLFSASRAGQDTHGFDGIICVGLDISERKETQAALEESEKRFRQMAENIDEVIFMYTGDWSEMLYVNSHYEEIWGRPVESLEENPTGFMEGIHPDDRDKIQTLLAEVADGEKHSAEYRVNEDEDYSRWVISEAIPIVDDNGDVTRIVGTVRDITKLKETQQDLEQALDEKANLLKEVHHRVKNNMQIISSIINLHEKSNYIKPSRMLDECQNRITSMAMIHDMLYQSENLAEVSFNRYVEELVTSLIEFNQVPESTVDVTLEIDPSFDLPLSQAVPCGLIIHELVSNACQHGFSRDRENELNVQMRNFEDHVVLRVQDNGPGFPDDFDPHEIDSVGFEILRALCEHELGGTIKIYSDPMTTVELNFELDDARL